MIFLKENVRLVLVKNGANKEINLRNIRGKFGRKLCEELREVLVKAERKFERNLKH